MGHFVLTHHGLGQSIDQLKVKNGFVISLCTVMNIPLKIKASGCTGKAHTICYQSTLLAGSKELNPVCKK